MTHQNTYRSTWTCNIPRQQYELSDALPQISSSEGTNENSNVPITVRDEVPENIVHKNGGKSILFHTNNY